MKARAVTSDGAHRISRSARLLGRLTDVRWMALLLWLVLSSATWATTIVLIKAKYATTAVQASASARELAQTYEAHAVRALREIDRALRTIEFAYQASGSLTVLERLAQHELLPPDLLFEVSIANEEGVVISNTRGESGSDVSAEGYFVGARELLDGSFIARPQRRAATEDWKLVFSRRLERSDGTFAGVAFITAEAAYFVSSYEPLRLGEHGMLAMIGTDQIVRVRRSGDAVDAGDRIEWSLGAEAAAEGALIASPWDGVTRFVSTRQLGTFPITVMVGLARDEQLASAHETARTYVYVAIVLSVLLSIIAAALGAMSWQLVRSQRREHQARISSAREAGMAEIATNVLHNVGNALNSVNVSATLVADVIRNAKVAGLTRAIALIREHEDHLSEFLSGDSRGKHLLPYLSQVTESLRVDQAACAEHISSLRESVDHMKTIVAMQQTFATTAAVLEEIDVIEVTEASLQMNVDALGRHSVEVTREYDQVPRLLLDKHSVLQILINLISNAKHACSELGGTDRRIIVRVKSTDDAVAISIVDNGIGIPQDNLTRIFQHGFTTRATGHGFGLHSSALAAKELGGSLEAYSEGPGRGATFTLAIPFASAGA